MKFGASWKRTIGPIFRFSIGGFSNGNSRRANVVTVWEGGRLIGMLGYMPVDIFWGDVETTRRGAWTANWVVDEDHRGDAGWLMLRQVGEMFDVTLGIGGKPETLKISKHLGWAVYPHIPRFLAILNKEAAAWLWKHC